MHAKRERQADVKEAGLDGVDAGDDERVDERHQVRLGPAHQPHARRHDQVADDQHGDVGDEQPGVETVHDLRVLHEQQRSGNRVRASGSRRAARPTSSSSECRGSTSARAPCTRPCCSRPPARRRLRASRARTLPCGATSAAPRCRPGSSRSRRRRRASFLQTRR